MRKGSLYEFNPQNTGLYEARLWKAVFETVGVVELDEPTHGKFDVSSPDSTGE